MLPDRSNKYCMVLDIKLAFQIQNKEKSWITNEQIDNLSQSNTVKRITGFASYLFNLLVTCF